ncbi:uncharacterized protein [Panulirus ornatus]|uniref:uncharacterized protein n=1 Tax=Panulirus ornatus TaxID=150431 RepID=UPI003A86E677
MDTGDVKYHQETRNEGKVIGEYRVKEADGSIRVVKYSADKDNGFQASVEYVTDHDEPEFGLRMKPFARGHGQRPFGHRSTFEPSRTNFRSRGQPGNRFQTSRTPSSSRFRGVSSPSRQDTFSSQTPLSANSRNSPSVQLSRGSPSSLFVATPGRQGAQRFQQGSLRRDEHHSRLPQDLNSFQHDDLPGSPRLQASQGFSRPGSRLGNLEEPRSQALRSEFKNQNNQGQKREQTGSQFQQSSFQNQDRKQLKAQSRDEYQESKRNSFQTQNRDNFQSQENKQFHSPVHGQPQIENNDRFQSQGKDQFDGENRDQYEINRRNRFQSPNRQFQSQTQLQNQGEAGQIQKNDRSPDIQFQAQNNRFHAQNRNQFQVEEESQFQSQERRQFHEQDTQFHPQDIRQFQSQDRRQSPAPESQFPIQERDDFLTQDGNQLQTQDRRQFTSQDRDQLRSQERRQYQTQESHFRTQDRRPFRTQDRNQIPAEDRSQFQSQQRGQFSSQERDLQYNEGNERLQPHTNDHFQTQSKDQLDVQGRRESQVEYSDQYQTQNRGNFLSQDGDQSRFEDINNFQREFHGPLSGDQFQGQQSDEFESQRAGVTATQHAHNLRSRNQFQASRTTQTQSQNRIQSDSRVDFDGSNSNTEQRQYDATERHGTDVKHETAAEDGSYSEEGGNENGNQRYGVKDSLNLGPYSTQRNRASVNIEVPGDLGSSNHRYAQTDASQTGSQRQRTTSGRYASQEDEFQHSRPGEFQNPQENVDIAQTGVYEAGQQYSRTQDRLPPFQEQTGRFPASSPGGGNRADFGDGLAPTPAVRPQFQSEDTTQTFQNPDPSAEDQFYGSREDKEAFRRTRVSAPVLTRPAFQTVAEPHPLPLN